VVGVGFIDYEPSKTIMSTLYSGAEDFKYADISIINIKGALMTRVESEVYLRRLPMRGRIDIIASILREAGDGSKKTRIMYRCNLSFRQMKVYLDILVEKNLLDVVYLEEGSAKIEVFKTTEDGRSFLKVYDRLKEILAEKGLRL